MTAHLAAQALQAIQGGRSAPLSLTSGEAGRQLLGAMAVAATHRGWQASSARHLWRELTGELPAEAPDLHAPYHPEAAELVTELKRRELYRKGQQRRHAVASRKALQ